MSCYKPLIRLYNPDDREQSGRVYSLARFSQLSGKQLKYEDLMYNPKVMLIPCGQCMGCRIRQREDWTTRIELEARDYPKDQVWFITLTYDDDHVPGMIMKTGEIMRKVQYTWKPGEKLPSSVQILLYEDIQKFLKRLRKAYRGKLRYFVAGEYGEQTARPHYHMILYGWEPTDLENLYKIHHNGPGFFFFIFSTTIKNTKQKSGGKDTFNAPTEKGHRFQDTTKSRWKRKTHKDCGESNRTDKKTP